MRMRFSLMLVKRLPEGFESYSFLTTSAPFRRAGGKRRYLAQAKLFADPLLFS